MKIKPSAFWLCAVATVAAGLMLTELVNNDYYFNALYVILQGTPDGGRPGTSSAASPAT